MHESKIDAPPRTFPLIEGAITPVLRSRLLAFSIFAAAICLAFALQLIHWIQFSLSRERNGYLLVVPFITAYLIWTKRRNIQPTLSSSMAGSAVVFGVAV